MYYVKNSFILLMLMNLKQSYSQYDRYSNSANDFLVQVNNFGAQKLCPVPNGTSVIGSVFSDAQGNFRLYGQKGQVDCQGGGYQYDVNCQFQNQQSQQGNLQIQFENFNDVSVPQMTFDLDCTFTNVQTTTQSDYYTQTGTMNCQTSTNTEIDFSTQCQYTNYVCTKTPDCYASATAPICIQSELENGQCGSCTNVNGTGTFLVSPFENVPISVSGDYTWGIGVFDGDYEIQVQDIIDFDADYVGAYTTSLGTITGAAIPQITLDTGTTKYPQLDQYIQYCQGYDMNGYLRQFGANGYQDNYDSSIYSANYADTKCITSEVTKYTYLSQQSVITKVGSTYTLTLPFVDSASAKSLTCFDKTGTQSFTKQVSSTGDTVVPGLTYQPFKCIFDDKTYIIVSISNMNNVYLSSFELGQTVAFDPDSQLTFYSGIDADGDCETEIAPTISDFTPGTAYLNFGVSVTNDIKKIDCFNSANVLIDSIYLNTVSLEGSRLVSNDQTCSIYDANNQNILQCGLFTSQPGQLIFSNLSQQYGITCNDKQSIVVQNYQDRKNNTQCQTQCYIDTYTESSETYNYICSHYYNGAYTTFTAQSKSRTQVFLLPQCQVPNTGTQTVSVTDDQGNRIQSTVDYATRVITSTYTQSSTAVLNSYNQIISRFLRQISSILKR